MGLQGRGMTGPLSPDGRSEWNGSEWIPIPPPPKPKRRFEDWFRIACVVLIVLFVLGAIITAMGD